MGNNFSYNPDIELRDNILDVFLRKKDTIET